MVEHYVGCVGSHPALVVDCLFSEVDQRRTTQPEATDSGRRDVHHLQALHKCSSMCTLYLPALFPVANALLISLQVKVFISGGSSLPRQASAK